MKKIKKLLAFALAMVMCLGMAVTASASSEPVTPPAGGTNSITVAGAKEGETYKIYKMLDLAVHQNTTTNAYDGFSYTLNEDWKDFWTGQGAGAAYIQTNSVGSNTYVVWKNNTADMETFGKAAAAAAASKTELAVQTATADGVTFSGLEGGYYLITSTYGTAATVGSTPNNGDQTIQEKNNENTGDKKVQEGNSWGTENDAQIGDTISFRGKVSIAKNSINVVYHDTMTSGLTFSGVDSVKVYTDEALTQELDAGNYAVSIPSPGTDTFQVAFTNTYVESLTAASTNLYISYTAVLNDAAQVIDPETNTAKITWGDNGETGTEIKTTTNTRKFQINKYDGTDEQKNPLADAKFQLYTEPTGGEALKLAVSQDGTTYRVVSDEAKLPTGYTMATDNKIVTLATGNITIEGVDSDKYYLEETDAPLGYNKLTERVEVVVDANNNFVSEIANLSGNMLPSTGGIGTTIFYVVGGLLVVGAGILLITKKRISKEQ